jgi:phosphoglycerate dehydrogenase-like enzyme
VKIAILDDYQKVALSITDWSAVAKKADITVFNDHIDQADALIERLLPFDAICVMRERTPLRRDIIERLPRLKFIASTGPRNISIDMAAAKERGISVANTGYRSTPTIELTWALILASARHLVEESNSIRAGGWQTSIGLELDGRVLGVLGLGNVGGQVARIGRAFGMKIIAWSRNLTAEAAAAAGAEIVTKNELFRRADVVTIHLILSERTRGLVGAAELALMKPTARLINTSRGAIVDEQALIETLRAGTIAGAAVDVFDSEPLPAKHPFRSLENLLATPHIGFVAEDLYRTFYGDAAAAIGAWIENEAQRPPTVLNARQGAAQDPNISTPAESRPPGPQAQRRRDSSEEEE